ncbi:50S ribosomal subunit protein L6 [Candidatus Blochmanniella floridana]|uniref:50S ribosomal protein L6 n=1 Tax=Blochmanniella floridana TaxID=203907 RepID=Q7VQD3_BLOFL|nr:50S ribosomal subunit protein L6 [Candidatus Blochmannia floridanus]
MEQISGYKSIICIPNEIQITIQDCCILVVGVLGNLSYKFHNFIGVQFSNVKNLIVYSRYRNHVNRALLGTTCSLINSMIVGVTEGFVKKLQLIGIGYRVSIQESVLNLEVGFSHDIRYTLPIEVKAQCVNQTEIVLTSINKQLIGQVAADLRAIKPPEPFKGKGIRYFDELVYNKDTKKKK